MRLGSKCDVALYSSRARAIMISVRRASLAVASTRIYLRTAEVWSRFDSYVFGANVVVAVVSTDFTVTAMPRKSLTLIVLTTSTLLVFQLKSDLRKSRDSNFITQI